VSRRTVRLRLGWAYLRHLYRQRFSRPPPAPAEEVLLAYREDRLRPLTPGERGRLPAMSRCVGCGLCALVVRRVGSTRPPDLANAYLRDLTLLPLAASDLEGVDPGPTALAAAAAACPVGVPIDEVAATVRRLAAGRDGRDS
jgi:hypothetical protein